MKSIYPHSFVISPACGSLGLLRVVTPVLQRLSTLALWILLCFSLLCQVSLVVSYHLTHVANIVLVVLAGVFLWVLFQDFDDFTATIRTSDIIGTYRAELSYRPGLLTSRDQWSHQNHRPWTNLRQQSPRHRAILSTGPVAC